MDPFSITVGTIGLISSLTTISIKLNELRIDFVEAKTEIDSMLREFTDLSSILARLQNSGRASDLPGTLSRDLFGVLTNCNRTILEAETLLQNGKLDTMSSSILTCH